MIMPPDTSLDAPSRLAALRATGLLDGTGDMVLDRLARLVTRLLGVPIAAVSLVDTDSQHFPGMAGIDGWAAQARGTPIAYSFCQHVVSTKSMLVVANAADHALLRDNPGFRELGVVAYAGVPLRDSHGETLGTLCAMDRAPLEWTQAQLEILEDLAEAAMAEIELRSAVRALVSAQEKLLAQATHDDLTGLLNRRGFHEQALRYLALAERTESPFLLVALDIDDFKLINDTLGHDSGDRALVELATLLASMCRAGDLVARIGGDEFMLLLANSGVDDMHRARERLHDLLEQRNQQVSIEYRLASSIGIAVWSPRHRKSLKTLQRIADEAMYADKRMRRQRAALAKGMFA